MKILFLLENLVCYSYKELVKLLKVKEECPLFSAACYFVHLTACCV